MTCLPFSVNLEFFVEFYMPDSKLEKLWEGIKVLRNLKRIILRCSKNLKELPNLSTATNLQDLDLISCSSLVELPSSIENAVNLEKLELACCSSLIELPSLIGNAFNLQNLDFTRCSSLVELPSSIGNAIILQKLDLSRCSSLVELPSSIGNAINLKDLDLSGCSSLVKLPSSIGNATNLQKLNLKGCSSLVELPSSIGNATNLQKLNLKGCSSLVELPLSIGNLVNLEKLFLGHCSSMVELSPCVKGCSRLRVLVLRGMENLVSLPQLPDSLEFLDAVNCKSLEVLDCSFRNPCIHLDFGNCFKLNEEARDVIIQTPTSEYSILPGGEVPSSIGNATNLQKLNLKGCSSLVELPSSIGNATNLQKLNLKGCSSLVELPLSIGNLVNLEKLFLGHCSSMVELSPCVKGCSRLRVLVLRGMENLVSLPQLPDSLEFLDAVNCKSLEVLDCSFRNPCIHLDFGNCFKLNEEARDVIIQTPTSEYSILPGGEVPSSIGNATNLQKLNLKGCSSLVELPSSIGNATNLQKLNLKGCSSLVELPLSIGNLVNLEKLFLGHCSSMVELSPCVKGCSRLRVLVLRGMENLVSLPQLPDSLAVLDADGCKSLEVLDCTFRNPSICLNFQNCFKLNEEARDVILETSTYRACLPGGEVPACFTYRAHGSSVTVVLNEKPPRTTAKFKACILFVNTIYDEFHSIHMMDYYITSKQNARTHCKWGECELVIQCPILQNHQYIFDIEAEEVTSTELVFEFRFQKNSDGSGPVEIEECGILQL